MPDVRVCALDDLRFDHMVHVVAPGATVDGIPTHRPQSRLVPLERMDDLETVLRYVSEHEMFVGPAPNTCGGCGHSDCASNAQEWAAVGALVRKLAGSS